MLLFRVGPVRSKTLPGGRVCACHTTEFLAPPNGILGKGTWENPPNFCLGKSCGVGETVWNLIRWMKHHMFFCWFHQSSSVYNIHKIPQVSMSLISKRVVCFIVFFLAEKTAWLAIKAYSLWSFASFQKARIKINKAVPCWWFSTYAMQVEENLDSLLNEVLLKVQGTFFHMSGPRQGWWQVDGCWWQIWMDWTTFQSIPLLYLVCPPGRFPTDFVHSIPWALGHRGPDEFR